MTASPALPEKPEAAQIAALDKAWKLSDSGNSEIAFRWFVATVRAGYTQARPQIAAFIQHIGRRKLVQPIYEELAKTAEGKAWAIEQYTKAKPGYHPITQGSIEKVLGL